MLLSPPGFDKRAHGDLTIANISEHPISRSVAFLSPPPKRGFGGTVAFRGKKCSHITGQVEVIVCLGTKNRCCHSLCVLQYLLAFLISPKSDLS